MQNLIADLEANEGELVVRLADESAFEVGGNIATAKGSVVFRNEMLELIQYAPTTETVHETPIIMFPPWINKYYILDLKEQNSLIRWVVDQGYTLFVVSWVNPDASYADIGMEDYIENGYLKSIEVVKEITDQLKSMPLDIVLRDNLGADAIIVETAQRRQREVRNLFHSAYRLF